MTQVFEETECECGHHKGFHFNEINGETRCVYDLSIGEKGIIDEGCKCSKFTPLTGQDGENK